MSLADLLQDLLESIEFNNTFEPDSFEPGTDNPSDGETPVLDPEAPPEAELPGTSTDLLGEKLDSIPVFAIADQEGAPLIATDDSGQKVAGIFISQEDAEEFIVELEAENPELATQVSVVPVSLAEVYQIDVSQEATEDDLDFAFVPEAETVEAATNISLANGEEYRGGVPLFVAREGTDGAYLTVEQDSQQVIPFFFELAQVENLIVRFEEERPESAGTIIIDVVPLEGVIEAFETSDDPQLENIVLIPTQESLEFLQSGDANNNLDDDLQPDVYRFFNQETGVHFYTASEVEKDNIIENLPNYILEGVSYETVDPLTGMDNANVVHRFLNQNTGVHIYTISEIERDFIENNLTNYEYEGEVFAAYISQVEGTIPIHRFYNSELDAHFYTPSEAERESVENDLPNYDYEGIAYYAYPADV